MLKSSSKTTVNFTFFGSSDFSIYILDELEAAGFLPSIIITTPDKPVGRKLAMTPTTVALWAEKRKIKTLKPAKLIAGEISTAMATVGTDSAELFIVASYGKIIPQTILDIPAHGTLNVHPSLLPKYRGSSPLQSVMLADDRDIGVSIMLLDAQMDHGPIVAQEHISLEKFGSNFEWPIYEKFEEIMGHAGGKLLAKIIDPWVQKKISPTEQDHSQANYTKKIEKEDGLITDEDIRAAISGAEQKKSYEIFRKIMAFHQWPSVYFFEKNRSEKKQDEKRIKITDASYVNGKLIINRVIPEGKKETAYQQPQAPIFQ